MADTFLERVLLWERAKAALEDAKADEAARRDALIEIDFSDRKIGTNSKPLTDGRIVKCVVEVEMKTNAERAKACIAKLEATGEEGKLLAARLFKWTPEVYVSELKKLPAKLRKIADKAVDPRTCRPSIKIEPKAGTAA